MRIIVLLILSLSYISNTGCFCIFIFLMLTGLNGSSALFRHEIAFVLGQMQDEVSIPYLKNNLENTSENEMVRHECAEALGAIATPECIEILKKYTHFLDFQLHF